MEQIEWNEFLKVELRVGTIIEVEDFRDGVNSLWRDGI